MTENIPAFKVPSKLKADLERLLAAKGYRRPDYLRRVLADAVRRDLAAVAEIEKTAERYERQFQRQTKKAMGQDNG